MDAVILDRIPFTIDVSELLCTLHLDSDSEDAVMVRRLADQAMEIGKPKAMYRAAYVEEKGDNYVVIDGVKLTSRVMRVNFDDVYRVFPYVATCGSELQHWSDTIDDIFLRFVADTINKTALDAALRAMNHRLERETGGSMMASMNPGSLTDWPIQEQQNLFRLLGGSPLPIGVYLKESLLMTPIKSVSGIRFSSKTTYENCQLCPREKCPGRRAPFDSKLYSERYA